MADAASPAPMPMRVLPGRPYPLEKNWELVFDTSNAKMAPQILGRLAEYPLQARSLAVLRTSLACSAHKSSEDL